MTEEGMRGVSNPSEILITHKEDQLSGIAIAATIIYLVVWSTVARSQGGSATRLLHFPFYPCATKLMAFQPIALLRFCKAGT